ncbi:MAG: 2-amino-4-hydroxy-6-hydroxymethyldihydropteridine diphosphokinase [Planctomycetota bacterium]|nr:2-amino-4-hydroxy-6-hydroxymethyldihydropteridine diphosphokinase [Planctomycetota bacterium]MDP6763571.1 2-amino-4-hydroxy-6-hydroxymethyldihydropteridine diphosphokinase [Planctomycetota bacterium]MDP6988214.1 2-amino-4-hydroxy-6-hydroxymethyldihydropteridine diphosphokinase [Planctomycetota bacterium]
MTGPWAGTAAFVALGGNVGDRRAHLDGAVEDLRATEGVEVAGVSRWIETAPVGGPVGQRPFLNGAVELHTRLAPAVLLERLQAIEARHGRDRSREVPDGPRTLDLDLLLHGDARSATEALTLPHPRLEERLFVLEPLSELAPDLPLPGSGLTVRARIAELTGSAAGAAL